MEHELKGLLKSTLKYQKTIFFIYWLVIIIGFVIGELTFGRIDVVINPQGSYAAETIIILATAGVIPMALKLYSVKMNRQKWGLLSVKEGTKIFNKWSTIRLLLLSIVAIGALAVHYLFLSSSAGFCALIVSFATLFCIPSKSKVKDLLLQHKEEINRYENNTFTN